METAPADADESHAVAGSYIELATILGLFLNWFLRDKGQMASKTKAIKETSVLSQRVATRRDVAFPPLARDEFPQCITVIGPCAHFSDRRSPAEQEHPPRRPRCLLSGSAPGVATGFGGDAHESEGSLVVLRQGFVCERPKVALARATSQEDGVVIRQHGAATFFALGDDERVGSALLGINRTKVPSPPQK